MLSGKLALDKKVQHRNLVREVDELREEVGRFERIFRGSRGYGFVDWDILNKVIRWNGGFWEFLGYNENDMLAISSPDEVSKFVHEDDRALLNNSIRRIFKGEHVVEITIRVKKKRKSYIWAMLRVEADRREDGWVDHISGIVFDISKLKLTEQARLISEARHQRIIQSSNDGIWEWSADKNTIHYSSRCWELLGYLEGDDEVNKGRDRWKSWQALMHPEDVPLFDKNLKSHLKFGTPFDIEYRVKAKDGKWRWIRGRGQAELDESGKATRMSGTNMDVTQLKQAEERVIKAKEQAENANRAKSEFLSSMSHELRTPLNAILGFAKLLATDEELTREQRASMREVVRAGKHLLQFVNDVLDLARIEAGRMEVDLQYISPLDVMYECIELVKPDAAKRNISIDCQSQSEKLIQINADAIRLKQIFLNLLSNAIKYNSYDGFVRISFDQLDGNKLVISVTDSGKGIEEAAQSDIFKPFNRLGEEGSNIEGAGIGLVITKTLVEQMGGTINFSSKPGRGTTFWIEFASVELSVQSAVAAAKNKLASVINDSSLPKFNANLNVLYIEDNVTNQRIIDQMLKRYQAVKITTTADPFEGIYRAKTEKVDLVLLDLDLRAAHGREVLKVLKNSEQTQHIPVVAISAKAMAHDIQAGLESGFDDYLTKPFEIEKFVEMCNRLFLNVA